MDLNDFERNFVKQMIPTLIKEVECLKDIDTIEYPNNKDPKFWKYKGMFLSNAFAYLAARIFFMSHDWDEKDLEKKFLEFCKGFESVMIF